MHRSSILHSRFELTVEAGRVLIVEERHYRLVPGNEIDAETKRQYADRA